MPRTEPYRAWATFQFTAASGRINECDVLIAVPAGLPPGAQGAPGPGRDRPPAVRGRLEARAASAGRRPRLGGPAGGAGRRVGAGERPGSYIPGRAGRLRGATGEGGPCGPRAVSVAEGFKAHTVEQLLDIPPHLISRARGAGNAIRKELNRRHRQWTQALRRRPAPKRPVSLEPDAPEEALESVDTLAARLTPPEGKRRTRPRPDVVRATLQLPGVLEAGEALEPWPAQSLIAKTLGISQPTVSQNQQVAVAQWAAMPWLGRVRDEVVAVLAERDRVSTAEELTAELRARHVAGADAPAVFLARALAVVRAADEAEIRKRGDDPVSAASGEPAEAPARWPCSGAAAESSSRWRTSRDPTIRPPPNSPITRRHWVRRLPTWPAGNRCPAGRRCCVSCAPSRLRTAWRRSPTPGWWSWPRRWRAGWRSRRAWSCSRWIWGSPGPCASHGPRRGSGRRAAYSSRTCCPGCGRGSRAGRAG